jgi:hypothetical protein
VVDEEEWERPLREKICFALLRAFIKKICLRLPDRAASMHRIQRALAAATAVTAHRMRKLTGRDYEEATQWVEQLQNIQEGRVAVGTAVTSSVPPVSPVSPVSQAARILLECTVPWGDGMADLSRLPRLPGLALDRWLAPKGMEALRSQLCKGLRSLNVDSIIAISKLLNLVASLSQLTSISLLGTRLREFPVELCQLTSLQSLVLGNQGPEVRLEMQGSLERLGALRSLTELRLRDVGLMELSWSADSSLAPPWPRLRILQVDDNKLTELPSWLTRLPLLEELDVSGNELSHLPDFNPDYSRRVDLANQLEVLGFHSELGWLLEAQGLQPPVPFKTLYVQRNLLTALPLALTNIRETLATLVANPQKDLKETGCDDLT